MQCGVTAMQCGVTAAGACGVTAAGACGVTAARACGVTAAIACGVTAAGTSAVAAVGTNGITVRQATLALNTKNHHKIAGTSVACVKSLAVPYTPGNMSLLNCEIFQRRQVSRIADTGLILLIAHLIRPPCSIPGVG